MQINSVVNQIKRELGPLDNFGPHYRYPVPLHSDVMGYIMDKIEYFSFFPNDIKNAAKEVVKTHKRFLTAKEALIISKNTNKEVLNFLYSGKCPLSTSEVYKKFLAVEAEEKKAFESFKIKYYAWYNEYKAKTENNPNGLQKLFNWELENRQRIPEAINGYLQNSLYDDNDHAWRMNQL